MKLHSGYGAAVLGYMAGIFMLSSLPEETGGAVSALASNLFHLPLFAGLAACLLLALSSGEWYQVVPWRVYVVIGLVASAYAAFDEIHQLFVLGRSGSVGDFFVDTLGVVALLCLHRLSRRHRRTA